MPLFRPPEAERLEMLDLLGGSGKVMFLPTLWSHVPCPRRGDPALPRGRGGRGLAPSEGPMLGENNLGFRI